VCCASGTGVCGSVCVFKCVWVCASMGIIGEARVCRVWVRLCVRRMRVGVEVNTCVFVCVCVCVCAWGRGGECGCG